MNPANDNCQRWTQRRQSWRHRRDGGFDRSRYDVEPIPDDTTAERFIIEHHYSGSYPLALLRYGLFDRGDLVGVAVLSGPSNDRVLTNVFPTLAPAADPAGTAPGVSMELGRFCLVEDVAANGETFFLARAFALAARAGVRGVVSFADPVHGHIGHIYQAKGLYYCGRTDRSTLWVMPDGFVFNKRTMQKIRKQERGCRAAEQVLIGYGARPRRPDENPAKWMGDALRAVGGRTVRHPGLYRYVAPLGNPTQRRHVAIAMPYEPYPRAAAC